MKRLLRPPGSGPPRTLRPVVGLGLAAVLVASGALASTLPGEGATAIPAAAELSHRMTLLVLQLGVLLLLAKLANAAFERVGVPGVLGEMAAGLAIGPHALGAVALPGLAQGLFPELAGFPLSPELYGFCAVGAVLLLFAAGLETDLEIFLRFSTAATAVGTGGVIGSFVVGDLVTVLFSKAVLGQPLGFLDTPCLFMGVVSTATSVGITARVLSRRGKIDSPEGATIVGGAVIDDVLGIVLLASVMSVASARDAGGTVAWGQIARTAGLAVGVAALASIASVLGARHVSGLLKLFRDRTSIAVMALGLAFILAGLFEKAGLAMIIGAYVMGLALSRTDIREVVLGRLTPIYMLVVPIFFACTGMMVDLHAFEGLLGFGTVFFVTAMLAKVVGCGLPALGFGFDGLGALRIGIGMAPRGEVAVIMASSGLAVGALTPELFAVAMLMNATTVFVAPWALDAALRTKRTSTHRGSPPSPQVEVPFSFPSRDLTKLMADEVRHAFDSEGFFSHSSGRGFPRVHQFRKDALVISLQQCETQLVFTCREGDERMVSAAMLEAAAVVERLISGLRDPVDLRSLKQHLESTAGSDQREHVRLSSVLSPDLISTGLTATTKEAAIGELLETLMRRGLVRDHDSAFSALLEREETMSTGLAHGIAMPHARTNAVDRLACAIGISRSGIDFGAEDGAPSRIIVLELAPEHASVPHLEFLSTMSQVLDEHRCHALTARALTPEEAYEILVDRHDPPRTGSGMPEKQR